MPPGPCGADGNRETRLAKGAGDLGSDPNVEGDRRGLDPTAEGPSADSRSGSEPARCAEAVVLLVFADDQMIGQREVEHGGCRFEARRESDIIRAQRRIAGRMIVCDQQ